MRKIAGLRVDSYLPWSFSYGFVSIDEKLNRSLVIELTNCVRIMRLEL